MAAAILPVHAVLAGRLRVRIPALRADKRLSMRLQAYLTGQGGIRSLKINPRTGTILVLYDHAIAHDEILRRIDDGLSRRDNGLEVPSSADLWHERPAEAVLRHFLSDPRFGLAEDDVRARLRQWGENKIARLEPRSSFSIFIAQFISIPTFLLLGGAVLSLMTGGILDGAAIVGVTVMNAVIGWRTEREAEAIIASLDQHIDAFSLVRRQGSPKAIDPRYIVPGDILVLAPGHRVPADARLIECQGLSVDESALTGESMPADKASAFVADFNAPLSARRNMVFRGTLISSGRGMAVVVGTGGDTEIGRVQALAESAAQPPTPLQNQLDSLGRIIALGSAGLCAMLFGLGIMQGRHWLYMLKNVIALAVAAVPEGLPTVATTALTRGVRDLRGEKILVRRLSAVESLGQLGVVCFDKTGTLTLNRMSVSAFESAHTPRLLEIGVLCNEAEGENGSPTELALLEAARAAGLDVARIRRFHPRRAISYRQEGRAYMSSLHEDAGGQGGLHILAVKGNPLDVLEMCSQIREGETARPLSQHDKESILAANRRMAEASLRILGIAEGRAAALPAEGDPSGLTWLGLVGMQDPMRKGLHDLVDGFHQAGIETVMITGDQAATAQAIARDLALAAERPLNIIDSTGLETMSEADLPRIVPEAHVFARVSPRHKLLIVKAWQQNGRIVAMTGDGVNDGPALKAADIGIAMGKHGTEAARDLADIVIEDDDLTHLAQAVAKGRSIHGNIRKSIHYLLATNLAEVSLMVSGAFLGQGQPLTAMQLLWINMLSDVWPGVALALDPADPDIMAHPIAALEADFLGPQSRNSLFAEAGVMTAGALSSYLYGKIIGRDEAVGAGMCGLTVVGLQLLYALSARSPGQSLFRRTRRPRNKTLLWTILISAGLQALALGLPGLRAILGTRALSSGQGVLALSFAGLPFLAHEGLKMLASPKQPAPKEPANGQ